ncbi:hypothetical protein BURKHO8Y_240239 [Burkholderia sp. 8Y]|nr:hypothetical protein BURKHO8Y_240239 [Burkholderia sp. 8Y]
MRVRHHTVERETAVHPFAALRCDTIYMPKRGTDKGAELRHLADEMRERTSRRRTLLVLTFLLFMYAMVPLLIKIVIRATAESSALLH